MAKISKEDLARLDGLQMALEIARENGLEGLEQEVNWRCKNRVCPPVRRNVMIAMAREFSQKELMYVACSMAHTLTFDLNMPPSRVNQYLHKFNEKMDLYRDDPEAFVKHSDDLNNDSVMIDMCKKYIKE